MTQLKKILGRILKVSTWVILSLILLLVLAAGAIQIPAVQNMITQKGVTYLQDKIKTEVRLDHFSLAFPKKIILEGIYLENQQGDTLLYAGKIGVDTDLWGLLKNNISLNTLQLENFHVHVDRSRETKEFNFDYIIRAFATGEKDTTASAWTFSLGKIELSKSHVVFNDSIGGTLAAAGIGELLLSMKEFDLEKSIYLIDEFSLENSNALMTIIKGEDATVVPDTVSSSGSIVQTGFKWLSLKNNHITYKNEITGEGGSISSEAFALKADKFDLANHEIDLSKLLLHNTALDYYQNKNEKMIAKDKPSSQQPDSIRWKLNVDEVDVIGVSLAYDDYSKKASPHVVDADHLGISQLAVNAKDLALDGRQGRGNIKAFSFKEKSGFLLKNAKADVELKERSLSIKDLNLETSNSVLIANADAEFESLASIEKTYPHALIDVNVKKMLVGIKDVMYFKPDVLKGLPSISNINLEAALKGRVDDFELSHLTISTFDSTGLAAKGHIRGLPDVNNASLNIELKDFHSSDNDIRALLPDTLLPKTMHIPEWLTLKGNVKGTLSKPELEAWLKVPEGNIDAVARLDLDSSAVDKNYDAKINIHDFHVGSILNDTTMGKLDMSASIAGRGLKTSDLDARVDLTVNRFDYNHYSYKDFKLDGTINKYLFAGKASMSDKNLDVNLEADLNYNESVPHYKLLLELRNADLGALHLTERDLRMRGTLDVDLGTADMKVINGQLSLKKFGLYNGQELYVIDSLLFISLDQEGKSEMSVQSDVLEGDFKGTINPFTLPIALRRHFNTYFSLQDTSFNKPVPDQDFKFKLVLKNTDLLTEVLLPDLQPFVPGEIRGEFSSADHKLDLFFGVSKIRYADYGVDSAQLTMTSDDDALDYSFRLRHLTKDALKISAFRFSGTVANDSIRTKFTILDSLDKESYVLGGVINSVEEGFEYRFIDDELMMNHESWTTPPDNRLLVTKAALKPHDFEVSHGDQKISLRKKDRRDSIVSLMLEHVRLEDLSSMVQGVTPVAGIADGDLSVALRKNQSFESNLVIKSLTILDQTWGDLKLMVRQQSTAPLEVDLGIVGKNADLRVAGEYISDPANPSLQFTATVKRLDLVALQPLNADQMKKMSGILMGEIKITGTPDKPDVNGAMYFKEAALLPRALNTTLLLKNEKVTITRTGISLSDFRITDANNNLAIVNGTATTRDDRIYRLNFDLNADNFQLLKSSIKDNGLFFGDVKLNAKIKIRGRSDLPRVNMEVSVVDKSDFTFVVPQSEKGVQDQEGIVKWVDKDAASDPFLASIKPADTVKAYFKGMDLTANIGLSDGETLNVIIDPITGDKLTVRGNTNLTFSLNHSGDMRLTGRYEITSGSYDFSFYKLVKRKFTMDKGSTITWYGDPMDAEMDLRAIYSLETAPYELMAGQMTTSDQSELNAYKQRLPFMVYLLIKGGLLKPEISFKLDMPMEKQNAMGGSVYARLQDINTRESDLNKQSFSLLVLQRFMADNPLDNGTASGVSGAARSSVSKILTDQLNRLSQNVKGVQISFDVKSYEDYSSGTAEGSTQLQLGLSKTLLDDRLIVKVSGNVDVEGSAPSGPHSGGDYIGDLALEYKLTTDGRLRITGFRNSNYDMIDGELIETGAGVIYIKDYNVLDELFKANEKEK